MANSNRVKARNVQKIYNKKRKIFKEKYLSPKGLILLGSGEISKDEAWKRYGKNRYITDKTAIVIYFITHNV